MQYPFSVIDHTKLAYNYSVAINFIYHPMIHPKALPLCRQQRFLLTQRFYTCKPFPMNALCFNQDQFIYFKAR